MSRRFRGQLYERVSSGALPGWRGLPSGAAYDGPSWPRQPLGCV